MSECIVVLDDDAGLARLVGTLLVVGGYSMHFATPRDHEMLCRLSPAAVVMLFHTPTHNSAATSQAALQRICEGVPVIACAIDRKGLPKARALARHRPTVVVSSFDLVDLVGAIHSVLSSRTATSIAA